jgi:hypothetical protein
VQESDLRADDVWKPHRWMMWTMVVVATLDSFVHVFKRWAKLDHFGSIVLVALLLVYPFMILVALGKGRRMAMESIVLFAYLLLVMAMSVFGH